jgi:aryl-alcohol dehydrogenase-like predicted oxidoreductase
VSPLTLGTMTFGTEWGWGSDEGTSRPIFDAYVDRGGNSIDTANFYTQGTSETLLGKFLKGKRDRLVLATKYSLNTSGNDPNAGGNHRKNLMRSLEASLERLATDYIDLYWIHAWESRTPVDEVMRALDDAVRSGKVLYIGMSNAPAWVIAQANTLADSRGWVPFIALQPHYNLIERSIERDLIPMALELGLGVMPWSPLAAGVLTGKYNPISGRKANALDESLRKPRQEKGLKGKNLAIAAEVQEVALEIGCSAARVAIAWLLGKRGVVSPIIGARTMEQLDDNLASLEVELSDAHLTRLEAASAIELGYPYSYLESRKVREFLDGGAEIERR